MAVVRTEDDSWDVTALGVAFARSQESASECPLITDPYVKRFVDAAQARGWQLPPAHMLERIKSISNFAASRTKWFDEFFIAAGANGIGQAVNLAAGLDARAWRLPWIEDSVVYEVDQPKVLAFKAETLVDDSPGARYVPVPIDLSQDWPKALCEAGFDVEAPTAWAAEGLLPNLPTADQDLLFERIHQLSAPGSRIGVEGAGSIEDRAGAAEWLMDHGWQVTAVDAGALMERYGRTTSVAAATPRTVFVYGQRVC